MVATEMPTTRKSSTTLAPGEEWTWGSPTTDIVTNVDAIRYDSVYRWMTDVEQPAHPQTPTDRYPVTGAAPHARPRGPERHERTPCSTEKEAQ
ncbi:hypothetical protein Misp01_79280 [Microtetraspora sp. NBRC 13810]|uniref:hypothetical protein n=1 Tax=Microtetraspora sp. NBRC 13810 TaxID=3030990 RepID=UPI0024A456AC|nr:hypothetical protein [Microtetraspora sp. NBRC 13810]GLW12800.1 hypothetical protein Misp01_79280 [Microtetraspora sp. NBRC 13810]